MLCVMSGGEIRCAQCVCVQLFISGLYTGQCLTCSPYGSQKAFFLLICSHISGGARGISLASVLFSFFPHITVAVYCTHTSIPTPHFIFVQCV